MSLAPKFTLSENEDATSVIFTDSTGDYNVTTNPGGYGAPNVAWSAVTYHGFIFSTLDGNIGTEIFHPHADFDVNRTITLQSSEVGYGTAFKDQVYVITYNVYTGALNSLVLQGTFQGQALFPAQTNSCFSNGVLSIAKSCACGFNTVANQAMQAARIRTLLFTFRYAEVNGDFDTANKGIQMLFQMCSNFCANCH